MTSRKPADTNRHVAAKFAPDAVAVSISVTRPFSAPGDPAMAKAMSRMNGSRPITAPITSVRRRFNWRTASTRSGSVRPGR